MNKVLFAENNALLLQWIYDNVIFESKYEVQY